MLVVPRDVTADVHQVLGALDNDDVRACALELGPDIFCLRLADVIEQWPRCRFDEVLRLSES